MARRAVHGGKVEHERLIALERSGYRSPDVAWHISRALWKRPDGGGDIRHDDLLTAPSRESLGQVTTNESGAAENDSAAHRFERTTAFADSPEVAVILQPLCPTPFQPVSSCATRRSACPRRSRPWRSATRSWWWTVARPIAPLKLRARRGRSSPRTPGRASGR